MWTDLGCALRLRFSKAPQIDTPDSGRRRLAEAIFSLGTSPCAHPEKVGHKHCSLHRTPSAWPQMANGWACLSSLCSLSCPHKENRHHQVPLTDTNRSVAVGRKKNVCDSTWPYLKYSICFCEEFKHRQQNTALLAADIPDPLLALHSCLQIAFMLCSALKSRNRLSLPYPKVQNASKSETSQHWLSLQGGSPTPWNFALWVKLLTLFYKITFRLCERCMWKKWIPFLDVSPTCNISHYVCTKYFKIKKIIPNSKYFLAQAFWKRNIHLKLPDLWLDLAI